MTSPNCINSLRWYGFTKYASAPIASVSRRSVGLVELVTTTTRTSDPCGIALTRCKISLPSHWGRLRIKQHDGRRPAAFLVGELVHIIQSVVAIVDHLEFEGQLM